MATIVPMPTPRTKSTRSSDSQDGATILFFTGVRYVRDDETDSDDADDVESIAPAGDEQDSTALSLI